jgi:hypothetical protein
MPSELEIAAAESAAQEVAPGIGGDLVRVIVRAALDAAEHVRFSQDIERHMPTGQNSQQSKI